MTKHKSTLLYTLGTMLVAPILYYGGQALNALVMAANNGQMPVLWPGGCTPAVMDGFHSCIEKTTRLKFLADYIVMHSGVTSPGDMFIYLGDALWYPVYYLGLGYLAAILWSQQCLQQQQSSSTSTQIGRSLHRLPRAQGRHRRTLLRVPGTSNR